MTNIRLGSIDDYVDVSSKTNYHTYHLKDTVEERLHRIHISSRDSARTPLQWDDSAHAGFSTATPWFYVNQNYDIVNVEAEEKDPDSILNFYRKCLYLRKKSKTLIYGDYREYFPRDRHIYMYSRSLDKVKYLVICSFARHPVRVRLPKELTGCRKKLILCNYPENAPKPEPGHFRPYEARVYRVGQNQLLH